MLPWREHDDPQRTRYRLDCFPTSTDYIPATQPFMVNYIVDDLGCFARPLKTRGSKD